MANLALFDLDMTMLNVDSDHSWGQFIVERGLVDAGVYANANDKFYQDYINGTLDAVEYNEFVADFLSTQSMDELQVYRQEYLDTWIIPNMRPKALEQIKHHKNQGDTVVVISATNDFVVKPIANLFGVDDAHTMATALEIKDNSYTGKVAGRPNFKEGKLYHLGEFIKRCQDSNITFDKTIAYSDSKNDLPLLNFADEAVCITPDDILRREAHARGWRIEDWSL